jgi:predicted dehydrogenase
LNADLPDIAYVTMHYPSRMVAHLNISWMSPVKVRRTAIGGSTKMAVWDDLDRDEALRIYDSGISVRPQEDRNIILPGYRIGDVHSPRLPVTEPLAAVVEHFYRVIMGEEKSIMDGEKGLLNVRTLEQIQKVMDVNLKTANAQYTSPILHGKKAAQ